MKSYVAITLGLLFVLMILEAVYGQKGCFCTLEYRPVCASNGQTYSNGCLFRCAAAQNSGELHNSLYFCVIC